MKQLEVQIMGQSYLLGCPEGGEARLLEAVERVDTAMCRIRDAGKVKARDRIAVLAALNLAFDLSDAAAPKATASTAPVAAPAAATPESAAAVQALIHRLDRALGVDGHLI
jgi:cell division protein ZapA